MLRSPPIKKLLFKFAIPTVIAQLINMLYNIVDRIYIPCFELSKMGAQMEV